MYKAFHVNYQIQTQQNKLRNKPTIKTQFNYPNALKHKEIQEINVQKILQLENNVRALLEKLSVTYPIFKSFMQMLYDQNRCIYICFAFRFDF